MVAGDQRHTGFPHDVLGCALRAHRGDRACRRSDEYDAGVGAGLSKRRVLRQEAIPGMDRLRAAATRDVDEALCLEIALARRRGADEIRLVAGRDVQRVGIRFGVHSYGKDAKTLRGARNAHRNLAAIGYEDLVEHSGSINHGDTEATEKTKALVTNTYWLSPCLRVSALHCFPFTHAAARFSRNALVP